MTITHKITLFCGSGVRHFSGLAGLLDYIESLPDIADLRTDLVVTAADQGRVYEASAFINYLPPSYGERLRQLAAALASAKERAISKVLQARQDRRRAERSLEERVAKIEERVAKIDEHLLKVNPPPVMQPVDLSSSAEVELALGGAGWLNVP